MTSREKIWVWAAGLLMFFTLLFILFSDNGYLDMQALSAEKEQLTERNRQLEQENVTLYREIDRLKNDMGYIETVARQQLGMVKEEEIVFKIDESEKGDK